MTLRELMGNGAPEVEVSGLAYSSRSVAPGTLFFCVPGFKADGHDFAADAVERGAVALVCERPLGLGVPEVVVDDVRAEMGPVAARFHGDPTAELEVVGITGTNGKTTTAFLVRDLLEANGVPTGLLGTVKQIVGGVEEPVVHTTPEAIDIQATFRRMVDGGDTAAAIEVSSHALELGRAAAIHYACRVFTNLTQDHLDFHSDMEAYFLAKRRLFDGPGPVIVNLDDPYGRRLATEIDSAIGFSIAQPPTTDEPSTTPAHAAAIGDMSPERFPSGGDISPIAAYTARDVRFDTSGSRFTADTPDGPIDVVTPLPGLFNVSNALAALAVARTLGVDPDTCRTALATAGRVPGRLEPIEEGQPFAVFVDFAHTPDSLDNVLRAARELTDKRLHVVFGAGGDRDRAKRPLMGEAAATRADRVIVTSDNPRSEDPEAIIAEVLAGTGPDVEREPDRRKAIALAVESAAPGDVVVIAGKGHEQGQELEGGRKEPFDDREVAREALRATLAGRR